MRAPLRTILVACLLLAAPATGAAHSALRSVGPSDEGGTRLEFSAPLESEFLVVSIDDDEVTGARLDPGDPQGLLVPPTGAGEILVRGLSRDGHVVAARAQGVRVVDGGARRASGAAVVADLMTLAGLAALVGLCAARFGVIAPAWRGGGPRPPGADDGLWSAQAEHALSAAAPAWWVAWWAATTVALAGPVAALAAQLAALDAGSGDAGTLLSGTRWGLALAVQWAAVMVSSAAAATLLRSPHRDSPAAPAWVGAAIAAPLALALVAVAASSHASSGSDAALGIGIDAAHLAATGVWLGGLVALVVVLPRARRRLDRESGVRLAAAVVVRFSAVAIACVALLAVTGVYRAIGELSSPGDLLDTGYGQALLVKLAVFAVLLCGGAYNRLVLHPRLERAALGLRSTDTDAADRLAVSVRAEIAVAAALMAVVALLVNLPPP